MTRLTKQEPVGGTVTCGVIEAECICTAEAGHDGPHVCGCGGSWDFDADGKFLAVRLPGPFGRTPVSDSQGVPERSLAKRQARKAAA